MKNPCPNCQAKGNDSSGDNLTIYPDGHGYCHACASYFHTDQLAALEAALGAAPVTVTKPRNNMDRDKEDAELELELIRGYPIGHPFRPELDPDVVKLYGVRYSTDGSGDPDSTYYPYRDGKQVIDAKKKTQTKRFLCITGKISKADLFGKHTVPNGKRGLLIITEGEDDALAAKTMLRQSGSDYSVVSVQNGANDSGGIDQALLRQIEFIAEFSRVAICFDQDKPGIAYAEALAEVLAPTCDVRVMELPCKDAYELLHIGRGAEFKQLISDARKYTPEGVIEGSTVTLEMLQTPSLPGYELPWPRLQHQTHGLRKGEITTVCAGTGIGKTTITRELGAWLATRHNLTIGNIYLEEQWMKTAQGFVAIDQNVPLAKLRLNPKILTTAQWEESKAKFFTSNKVHMLKHFGSVQAEVLLNKLRYMALGLGCDFIFLDHITMVMSGIESRDERKDIDVLMTRLAELVTETGVGIVPVVHLKRTNKGAGTAGFNEGGEVSLTDLRGSSQLEALSFNVWAAERNQQSDTQSDVLTLRGLKNREWGFTGVADKLVYHHDTGRLATIEVKL